MSIVSSDSDSSSSYVPSDSEYTDMNSVSSEEEDTVDYMETELNPLRIRDILERRKSTEAAEIMTYCTEENDTIASIYKIVLERIDSLNNNTSTPKFLTKISKDTWLHILEYISDHIECVTDKIKHC